MKVVTSQANGCEFIVGDLDAFGVWIGVQLRPYLQAFAGRRSRNQVDDDLVTDQGLSAPVEADVREQSMLDFISLACPWWEMADPDWDGEFIGESLQLQFPQPNP